jgi:hypothetical protein
MNILNILCGYRYTVHIGIANSMLYAWWLSEMLWHSCIITILSSVIKQRRWD